MLSSMAAGGIAMIQPNARERIERFAQQLKDGDPDLALRLIVELTSEFPDQAPLHLHHARALRAVGRDAEALAAVLRMIQLKADYAPAWLMKAELSADADGLLPEADLRKALALDAGLARAHFFLARVLYASNRRAEAEAELTSALDWDPGQHDAYAERAQWRRREAAEAKPNDEDQIQTPAGLSLSLSKLQAARADFLCALQFKNDPAVRAQLGEVLHELGEFELAMAAFDAVLAVTPSEDDRYAAVLALRAQSIALSKQAARL